MTPPLVSDSVFSSLENGAFPRGRASRPTVTPTRRAIPCARDVARVSVRVRQWAGKIPPQAYFEPINWHRTALHELGHYAEPRIMPHGADWGGTTVFGIIRALRGRRAACHPGDIGPVTVTLRSVTSPLDSE